MPLISEGQKPFKIRHSVGFWMRDRSTQERISVYVSFEALNDLDPEAVDGVIAILKGHRKRIEELASDKFDQGARQDHTSVLIATADLNDSSSANRILHDHSAGAQSPV